MKLLFCILLGAVPAIAGADTRVGSAGLLRTIRNSKSIALVDLVEVVKKGDHPHFKTEAIYLLRVRPVEKWRGPFPPECVVEITLLKAVYDTMQAGDQAILFVSSSIDPLRTAQLDGSNLGLGGQGFWHLSKQADGRHRLNPPATDWMGFTPNPEIYKDKARVEAIFAKLAEEIFPVIRDLAKALEKQCGSNETSLFDKETLAPLWAYYDRADAIGRSWVHHQSYWGMFEFPLTPPTLRMVISYIQERESWLVDGRPTREGPLRRSRMESRLRERKPGDQVPDYLRNLPKDDDEAIKQALERFLREYEKDKKNKQ